MDPHYTGINLNASEKTEYLLFLLRKMLITCHAYCSVMKFMTKSKPFYKFLFDFIIVNNIELIDWWKSQTTGNSNGSVKNDSVI